MEVGKLLRSVPKEVGEINEELENIQVFINAADRMDTKAEQRKVKNLREATLRIEEVTEDYIITQQQHLARDPGCEAILHAATNFIKTMILLLQISHEIQDIKSIIRQIKERSGLQIQSSFEIGSISAPQHALRKNALYIDEVDVVGFEAPRDKVIGWLKENREKCSVIVVLGMGGQGKTTLAKIVYERVKCDFDCYVWITVSRVYTVRKLLRTMLEKFGKKEQDIIQMSLASLTKEVKSYMREKRYVIFFDDIWDKEFGTDIERIMLDNKKRSRIVITTRNNDVANVFKKYHYVHTHEMLPLSLEQSLKLFYKKAFRNELDVFRPRGFEDISSKIVEKCQGLPLAIVAIGSLLACQEKNPYNWGRLSEPLNYELDKNPNSTSITNILGLSYNALPYHLKSCFLYFGIYPKGYEVESNRLIRQWTAEGFIKSNSHKTLEEVAEQYLKELIDRSLVQASSYNVCGNPQKCRVHELLHDMIHTKIEDIGFCSFACDDGNDHRLMNSGKIRRLQIAIDSDIDYFGQGINEGSLIRTLHVFRNEELNEGFLGIIPTKFMRLKVINFQDVLLNYIPPNLGYLIRLRYLSFRNTSIKSLPRSIGLLQNLETLDLRGTLLNLLPIEINHLQKLRHLLIQWSRMMGGFGGLKSLQTLRHVKTDFWGEAEFKELEKLRQLRSLSLTEVNRVYARTLYCSINKMPHLEKLIVIASEIVDWDSISFPKLQKLRLGGKLERFQMWIIKHTNLVKLSLVDSNLNDDPMDSLMTLPNLLSLGLENAYVGTALDFKIGGFHNLRKLVLGCLVNLNSITVREGALPSLKAVELYDVPELGEIPSSWKAVSFLH
ncbi:PREDICTED: disease resistance protein RPM1-like [Lupinus angustifolius]|uniref:disease resistance protein RPM1-like n=1 Tax=Lupinus angustifolius TaxID=3871 RepID=UPI00092EEA66|nr:PREDICTED: disease resistance protein RPM1-like [Lupinus angustifolius]